MNQEIAKGIVVSVLGFSSCTSGDSVNRIAGQAYWF